MIFSIDPGPEVSGWCTLVKGKPFEGGVEANFELEERLLRLVAGSWEGRQLLVCEMPVFYGNVVGKTVIETALQVGRFERCVRWPNYRISRPQVCLHLCGTTRGVSKARVNRSLKDRFDELPTKKKPNPNWNGWRPTGHAWDAVALGVTLWDRLQSAKEDPDVER